jgi:2',3'-cyclic-nucleotide 2'-phosphodiesterase (5'-nucleotidase family)
MTRRLFVLVLLALQSLVTSAQDGLKPLTILHSNDLHAQLLPDERDQGGMARLATAVRREKAGCQACLYLNAGDLAQGSPVSTIYQGLPVYKLANLLGIDAGTLGNHEFDYGWRRTREFSRVARYPLLSANVVNDHGDSITGKPYTIKTVGGLRVGIIGVVLGDLVSQAFTSVESVGPWKVLPVVETVGKYAHELQGRTDLIIVLGHIHDKEEVEAILRGIPEVAVVVAGHTHVGYPRMMEIDGRVAVLVKSYGVELGRLDLKVDAAAKKIRSAEWSRIPIDRNILPAADVAKAVAKWENKVSQLVDVPIGEAARRLDKAALLGLFEKALIQATHADFVFLDPGSLRDRDIPAGKILARQVWNILPYDNEMVIGKFKGSQLPATVTKDKAVDPNREYTLAVTDFTAVNQSSPTQLGTMGLLFRPTGLAQRDAVLGWIRQKAVIP